MNLKALVAYVIDESVRRIVHRVEEKDDELVAKISQEVGKNIEVDYTYLVQCLDWGRVADEIDLAEIAEHFPTHDLAREIDLSDLAYSLDCGDIAEHISESDVAENMDPEGVADAMGDISPAVAAHLNYKKLAEALNPQEALAAMAPGEEGQAERLKLDTLAGKMVDQAVDKLLGLACKLVEEEMAHEQKDRQESAASKDCNGQGSSLPLEGR
ncbi:hypothetical protein CMI37_16450 [Candidatus Pacearchaeota archaeon]|nr:hypothetical protein [Candidatus Pacearchaeota archaeon]|tara:strand:+ start:423 stop:1061 length:639 start_codon:yes stop_codon:yes gene_type:complete